jgi:hypothetical protein
LDLVGAKIGTAQQRLPSLTFVAIAVPVLSALPFRHSITDGKNDRQCEVGETLKVANTSRNVKIALPVLLLHAPLGISGLPC